MKAAIAYAFPIALVFTLCILAATDIGNLERNIERLDKMDSCIVAELQITSHIKNLMILNLQGRKLEMNDGTTIYIYPEFTAEDIKKIILKHKGVKRIK